MRLSKTFILFSILSFRMFLLNGQQNLVPNPSFELIDSCPVGHYIGLTDPWIVQNWHVPPGSITTPDLFSTCNNGYIVNPPHLFVGVPNNFAGICYPNTGDNYMGFMMKYGKFREYIQVQLSSPLIASQYYLCGFHTQKSDSCIYATSDIGMHISSNSEFQFGNNQPMEYLTPQITNNTGVIWNIQDWTKIENVYLASGGEAFITIGNFVSNQTTMLDSLHQNIGVNWPAPWAAYYYFDDVYVIPYNENLTIEIPDTICWGEAFTLTAHGSAKYDWYINEQWYSNDSTITLELNDKLVIKVVGYIDTLEFEAGIKNCHIDCSKVVNPSNIFTPNGDGINDFFEFNTLIHSLEIFNRWGNSVFKGGPDSKWDGGEATDGVYFYQVFYDCENETHLKTGFIELIR
ncbi:gliding motility-associated C-terminal domain-containing protein [Fluviicola sp.]|uniref:T9SS type B sorting domain-containing protein n=1 Tax=Fluviicola sp. TaxID=1917219 RepID=UPI0031DB3311